MATFAGVHRTPLLANALLFDIVLKAASVPPPPLRGTSPERGRLIYGAIFKSTLPQLFIIHQRSGFIIQYSFVPMYHPGDIVPMATFAGG